MLLGKWRKIEVVAGGRSTYHAGVSKRGGTC